MKAPSSSWQALWMFSSASVVQLACSALGSIPQQVSRLAQEPVGVPPLLVLPELLVLEPLLEPLPLPLDDSHWLEQFEATQLSMFMPADWQSEVAAFWAQDWLEAAVSENVPPGHAQEM